MAGTAEAFLVQPVAETGVDHTLEVPEWEASRRTYWIRRRWWRRSLGWPGWIWDWRFIDFVDYRLNIDRIDSMVQVLIGEMRVDDWHVVGVGDFHGLFRMLAKSETSISQ